MNSFWAAFIASIVAAIIAIVVTWAIRRFMPKNPEDSFIDSLQRAAKESLAKREKDLLEIEAQAVAEKERRNASSAVDRARDHLARGGFFKKRDS